MVNARDCSFHLLRHHVTRHLFMPSFVCAQLEYCLSLLSWGCMCLRLLVRMARLLA